MASATVARRSAHYRLARITGRPAHLTTSMAMPRTCLDTAETPPAHRQMAHHRPCHPRPSISGLHRPPGYGFESLGCDLDRFTFLPGGNDGEFLTPPRPALALRTDIVANTQLNASGSMAMPQDLWHPGQLCPFRQFFI